MKSALLGVLLEQERQFDENDAIVDESCIALEYSKYTRESRIEAHQRAKRNESSLRSSNNNSNHSSSSSTSSKSSSSRLPPRYSSRKTLLPTDEHQQQDEGTRRYRASSLNRSRCDFVEGDLYTISLKDTTESSKQYPYTPSSRFSSRSAKRHLLRLATLRNPDQQERE